MTYSYTSLSSIKEEDWYAFILAAEAATGYPIIFNGNFSTNSYVPYSSTGHYVLGTGIKTSDGSNYTAIISDPYKVGSTIHAGIWEMPLSKLKESNQKHSSGGYCITADATL